MEKMESGHWDPAPRRNPRRLGPMYAGITELGRWLLWGMVAYAVFWVVGQIGVIIVMEGVYAITGNSQVRYWKRWVRVNEAEDLMNPWPKITPNENLDWRPCYSVVAPGLKCARLQVPMDYDSDTNNTNNVEVALLLVPARPNAPPKRPLLINPGGPGGSGVLLALTMGKLLQTALTTDQPIIGFDPRGIGFTTPTADCWATPGQCEGGCPDDAVGGLMHRMEWMNMNEAFGLVNSSDVALRFLSAGQRAVNDLCRVRDRHVGGGSILGHASTAHVARDMVSIVDAWDRNVGTPDEDDQKGKLVYWGFSYGTYLGATFARMFPDRVGRMMLDGVVDAELYEEPLWSDSLRDADKILEGFFEGCAKAGKKTCKLDRGDGAAGVKKRYEEIMERLEMEPVTFTHPWYFFPVIVRAEKIKTLVFAILYSPRAGFEGLAALLDDIYERRYEVVTALFGDSKAACSIPGNAMLASMVNDAQRAIMCADKRRPVDMSVEELREEYAALAKHTQFADVWVTLLMTCNGWDIDGDRERKEKEVRTRSGWGRIGDGDIKTAFPMLFLSNSLDPVTPLYAAVKMARKFEGAGLLEQRAMGHCTVSTVSRCTAKAVRNYIFHGKVPPPPVVDRGIGVSGVPSGGYNSTAPAGNWTRCDADEEPFGKKLDVGSFYAADGSAEALEEVRVMEAFQQIQEIMARFPRWTTSADDVLKVLNKEQHSQLPSVTNINDL